jgi:hypothetical protein
MSTRPPEAASDNELLGQLTTIDQIGNPLLQKALALWTERKGERAFPSREDMTPRAMAAFLRNAALVKVIDGGRDYQFRVVGDAITEIQGNSFQGLTLGEIDKQLPGYGSLLRPTYDLQLARGGPVAFRGHIRRSPVNRAFFHETVTLPLGADGVHIDHILVVSAHTYESGVPSR